MIKRRRKSLEFEWNLVFEWFLSFPVLHHAKWGIYVPRDDDEPSCCSRGGFVAAAISTARCSR